MKILYIKADKLGCGYYRCDLPAKYLSKNGHEARTTIDIGKVNWDYFDIIILQRQNLLNTLDFIEYLKSIGKTVIVENDDDFLHLPHGNVAKGSWTQAQIRNHFETARLAHAVTVTSPELAEVYKPYNKNVYVIPNCLELDNYKITKQEIIEKNSKTPEFIGWAGGAGRDIVEDVKLAAGVMNQTTARYPTIKAVMGGSFEYLAHLDSSIDRTFYLNWAGLNYCQRETCGATELQANKQNLICPKCGQYYVKYPNNIRIFDIGLAPLDDIPFNLAKSALKAIEYNALGIPVVSSRLGPYSGYIEDGKTGLLVGHYSRKGNFKQKLSEWGIAIDKIMNDKDFRTSLALAGREKAVREHDISKQYINWEKVYSEILLSNNSK